MLLALALMALAAGLVIPALVKPAGAQLRTASANVASLLRRTREHAINSHEAGVVRIDIESGRLEVEALKASVQIPSDTRVQLFTARSELESDTVGRIRFFPDGSATGGRVTLSLAERRYLVDVDWLTGRISVLDSKSTQPPVPPAQYQALQ